MKVNTKIELRFLGLIIVVLSLFFSAFGNSSENLSDFFSGSDSQNALLHYNKEQQVVHNYFNSFHFSSNSSQGTKESNLAPFELIENEERDDFNDEDFWFTGSAVFESTGASHLSFSRLFQFEQLVQNKSKVSLIILFHSWKSFLC